MALFKPFRGARATLPQEMHDGYAYFCTDDGSFHIDFTDADGNLQRKQINAKDAETLTGMTLEEIQKSISWNDLLDRPFGYETEVETPLTVERTFTDWCLLTNATDSWSTLSKAHSDGCIVKVYYDDEVYLCTAETGGSGFILVSDTELPFTATEAVAGSDGSVKFTALDGGTHTVLLTRVDAEVVKVPEEYIPDTIATTAYVDTKLAQPNWSQNDVTAADYVKNRTHYESKEDVNELLNIAWDGNIEGLTIGTSGEYTYDNVNGIYTFYKVSDTILTDEQIKLVTRHISITNEYGTSEHHHLIGDLWQSIVDEGNVTDSFVYADYVLFVKSPSSDYNECGIYFAKVKEFSGSEQVLDAVTTSITTDEPIEYTKTVVHKLNEKFIPDTIARLKDVPAKPRITTVTLPASAWAGDAQPWSQVVTVNTVTANSKLDLQPTAQQIVSLQNSETTLMASNEGGTVTFFAIGTKPTVDYTMQVLLTEVTYV